MDKEMSPLEMRIKDMALREIFIGISVPLQPPEEDPMTICSWLLESMVITYYNEMNHYGGELVKCAC